MQNHKTVEEKSNEWGITSRHVQHLCRSGKIEGAIKRAGSWFIPADTTSPAKKTRSDANPRNSGVSQQCRIIYTSILDYEPVTRQHGKTGGGCTGAVKIRRRIRNGFKASGLKYPKKRKLYSERPGQLIRIQPCYPTAKQMVCLSYHCLQWLSRALHAMIFFYKRMQYR